MFKKILFQTLVDEHSRPSEKRNLFAIAKLATCMLDNTNLLRMLNMDTPFVKDIKAELDKASECKRHEVQKVTYSYFPGSLLIDSNSIAGKPQETTPEERAADRPVF